MKDEALKSWLKTKFFVKAELEQSDLIRAGASSGLMEYHSGLGHNLLKETTTNLIYEKDGIIYKSSKLLPQYQRQSFLKSDFIKGLSLNELPQNEFSDGISRYIRLLSEHHREEIHGFGHIVNNCGIFEKWEDYLWLNYSEHLDYLVKCSLITKNQFSVLSALPDTRINLKTARKLHGDPSGENILFTFQSAKLIDFEDEIAGDPLYDFAFLFSFYPEIDWRFYFGGYLQDKEQIKRFWAYFARISVMKLVLLHKTGVADLTKGKKRISSFIENSK